MGCGVGVPQEGLAKQAFEEGLLLHAEEKYVEALSQYQRLLGKAIMQLVSDHALLSCYDFHFCCW